MTDLIGPDDLPDWIPGRLTVHSPTAGWDGLSVRGYRYPATDVAVPPLRDFTVVAYQGGATQMHRRVDRRWRSEALQPGDVSLLTRAAPSDWRWADAIDVVHVYVSPEQLTSTSRQMYERDVTDVELRDELRADDPAIHRTATALAHEAAQGGAGSQLLIDSLTTQLCVHILRNHAEVRFRVVESGEAALTFVQERAVRTYVGDHLHESITLDDLAGSVGLSRYHFARRFRPTLGVSPHEFVLGQRTEAATRLLTRTRLPLVEVAARCGFADQSHMNRVFRRRLQTTPASYRAAGT